MHSPSIHFIFGLTLIIHSFNGSASADSPQPPKKRVALMVSLGDSLTAGTFANTTAIESESHKKPIRDAFAFVQGLLAGIRASVNDLSWSSGKDVTSHFVQLRGWMELNEPDTTLYVRNFAVPGSRAPALKKQALKVVEAMKSGKYDYLKYVTLTIGGNDICLAKPSRKQTAVELFQKSLRDFFEIIASIRQKEPILIFISSIPNAAALGRPEFLDLPIFGQYTCKWIRNNLHNSCANLNNYADEEGFNKSLEQVIAQNALLQSLAVEAPVTHPEIQTFYSDSLFKTVVTPEMMSYDCFHPNKHGQDVIGRTTFAQQPFFKFLDSADKIFDSAE